MPPRPALGQPGVRPEWLVSAEDGVGAEASRMSIASRPPVIKPGMPKPPKPAPPVAAGGAQAPFQMAIAGSTPAGDFTRSPASPPPPSSTGPTTAPGAAGAALPSNPFAAAFREEAATGTAKAAKVPDDVPWIEPELKPVRKDRVPVRLASSSPEPGAKARSAWTDNPTVRLGAVVALAVVLAVVAFSFRPRGEEQASGTRIAEIRKNPQAFDGQMVTVSGRVGEIFQIGPSWAYYLHDGHDALLVFTRKGAPETLKRYTVTGTISTGQLEGDHRPSLFERAS